MGLCGPIAAARAVTPPSPQAAAPEGAARPAALLAACTARPRSSGWRRGYGAVRSLSPSSGGERTDILPLEWARGCPAAGVAVRRFLPRPPLERPSLRAGGLWWLGVCFFLGGGQGCTARPSYPPTRSHPRIAGSVADGKATLCLSTLPHPSLSAG